jgi:hypothetical protein
MVPLGPGRAEDNPELVHTCFPTLAFALSPARRTQGDDDLERSDGSSLSLETQMSTASRDPKSDLIAKQENAVVIQCYCACQERWSS